MAKLVDARGQACPQPVILTRSAMKEDAQVTTIVDNETSQNNVTKMAQKQGATVQTEIKDDGIYLHISQPGAAPGEHHALPQSAPTAGPLVLVVSDECMGRGEPELGSILMRAFFHTLGEVQPRPETIIFFNSGVKLVAEGSKILDDLLALKTQGIEILACGTCLDFYGIKDKIAVGEISNMYTIAETILNAGKVVNL